MSEVYYGYYHQRYKPWICCAIKRINTIDFPERYKDVNDIEWILIEGVIADLEAEKGEG